MNRMQAFLKDEGGATAIEYGLIAALIALAIITGAQAVGNGLNGVFNDIAGKLTGAGGAGGDGAGGASG